MFDVDQYRANALHCLRMAEDPLNWDHKQAWLKMAETWLGMIPEPQRNGWHANNSGTFATFTAIPAPDRASAPRVPS